MLKALKNFNAKIVCGKTLPFSGLVNGKLYLIAENSDCSADALEVCISDFKSSLSKNTLIYSYEVCVIENVDTELSGSPLHDAVHRGYNVIVPLYIPDSKEQKYMVARVTSDTMEMQIPFIITQAEDITESALIATLKSLARNRPRACKNFLVRIIHPLWRSGVNHIVPPQKLLLTNGGETIESAPATTYCCTFKSSYVDPDYHESEAIIERFVSNLDLIEKLEQINDKTPEQQDELDKAEREVGYAISTIPKNKLCYLFIRCRNLGPEVTFDHFLNRSELAAKSQIKVSVEAIRKDVVIKTNNKQKTNGTFRVYLTKGSKTEQVVFKRRASCIIYIMYLMDRKKRGDQVDTISIKDNEELFMKLYSYVYPDQKEIDFVAITTKSDGGSRLPNYFTDIRDALYDVVGKFGDSPLPFYIPNSNSHITVRSENIKITKEFKDLNLKV